MTNNRPIVLQDIYLNQARRERIPVTVKMVDGGQLSGTVRGFDSFTVILEDDDGSAQMLYKHAIAAVIQSYMAANDRKPPARSNSQ